MKAILHRTKLNQNEAEIAFMTLCIIKAYVGQTQYSPDLRENVLLEELTMTSVVSLVMSPLDTSRFK